MQIINAKNKYVKINIKIIIKIWINPHIFFIIFNHKNFMQKQTCINTKYPPNETELLFIIYKYENAFKNMRTRHNYLFTLQYENALK